MKNKFLHKAIGVAVMISCYGSVMATDIGVTNDRVLVYDEPKAEALAMYELEEGEKLEVNDEVDGYYEVIVDGELVYIDCTYITLEQKEKVSALAEETKAKMDEATKEEQVEEKEQKQEKEEVKSEEADSTKAVKTEVKEEVKIPVGQKVADYAKQFIGTPYVTGGNSLTSGVDCSGFTQQVYKHFGVNIERTSRSQYATNGYAVTKEKLLAGDLVFYGYGSVCHVAIYVGDGQVIHAPVPGKSVCVVPLWQRGDAPIIGYKRIFMEQ